MWCSYFSSYASFSFAFPQLDPIEIFRLFHSENLNGSLYTAYVSGYAPEIIMGFALFLLTPICFALLYSGFFKLDRDKNRSGKFLKYFSKNLSLSTLGLPSSFSGKGAYSNFLHSHFSNNVDLLSKLGTQGFEDCKISRVFHGALGQSLLLLKNLRA